MWKFSLKSAASVVVGDSKESDKTRAKPFVDSASFDCSASFLCRRAAMERKEGDCGEPLLKKLSMFFIRSFGESKSMMDEAMCVGETGDGQQLFKALCCGGQCYLFPL